MDEIQKCETIRVKATEQHFPQVLSLSEISDCHQYKAWAFLILNT